jgi:hypothetical protein
MNPKMKEISKMKQLPSIYPAYTLAAILTKDARILFYPEAVFSLMERMLDARKQLQKMIEN